MDTDKILETLFPHASILSGIFGSGGQGGLLNNIVQMLSGTLHDASQAVPQAVQAVAPGGVPAVVHSVVPVMHAAAPGGVPGIVNSVAPGGIPGVVSSVLPSGVPGLLPGQSNAAQWGVFIYGDNVPAQVFPTYQQADQFAMTVPGNIPVQIIPLVNVPTPMAAVSGEELY